MTIQELDTQVSILNPVDKAKLINILTQTLTNSSLGIKKTLGVCGGDACIGNTRIPVWSLVCDRHLGDSDATALFRYVRYIVLVGTRHCRVPIGC